MADGWVLIDTSAWIHALRPSGLSQVRERVRDVLTTGRAATCEMVVLELAGGTRTEREYRELIEDLGRSGSSPLRMPCGALPIGWLTACDAVA